MKIAIINFGHVDVTLTLFKNLIKSSLDINLIFCFSLNRKSESVLNFKDISVRTGYTDYNKTKELLGPEIVNYLQDITTVRFFIFHNLKLRSLKNFFLAIKFAKSLKNYDIIHFNGTNGVLPILIFLLRKKKLIFTIHDIHSHSGEKTRLNFAERLNNYIARSKYPLIIQNMSDFTYLLEKYTDNKTKFWFIPFGVLDVYRAFENSEIKTPESDLLFFGRISPYKGVEFLIEALKILKKKGYNYKTIIAGGCNVYFNTDDLNELNILLINRYIPNSELVSLIKNTKVVVCPYTDATQSGVAMTAFAFNKPVIASSVGSFTEVIEDGITGSLVKPRDPEQLGEKIHLILNKPDLLREMESNIQAIQNEGNNSWSHIIDRVKNLYFLTFN
ncbi:MAG: glycosyltransferase family 4 protein [Spirochaetes bacterium]|nr:glycosyltransferase family 4 protein [Spirochaetota bacterium]